MKFGLMFFASSQDSMEGNIYQTVKDCASFGDKNNFSSIWVPERHFTEFGGVYPNPAVLLAGLATITENIQLVPGSVVFPLPEGPIIATNSPTVIRKVTFLIACTSKFPS